MTIPRYLHLAIVLLMAAASVALTWHGYLICGSLGTLVTCAVAQV